MSIVDDFTRILEKGQEAKIIPFLQTLDKAQKKQLVPELKKLYKIYSEYKETKSGSYKRKGTDAQIHILGVTGFVCHNRKDFAQDQEGILNKKTMDAILPWYCPTWFNDFINHPAANEFSIWFLDYAWYMEMAEHGYIGFNPAILARLLPYYLYKAGRAQQQTYLPDNLIYRSITLAEHIWYLFEHESDVHLADKPFNLPGVPAEGIWTHAFKTHSDAGRIDRQRVLKECLKAANSNFAQYAANWFVSLFMHLEPSKTELLTLQDDLLHLLNSPHSKPVNTAIKYIKDICDDAGFNIDAFLDHVPLLLSSESKATVSTTLMTLDKLAKKYKDKAETIMGIGCQAFIHQDNSLQVRAAKLLQKYGDPASEDLKAALAAYQDALLFDARNLLTAFLDNSEEVPAEASHPQEQPEPQQALVQIPYPQTFDELVFLASQAFDNNQPYHFDLLPAALLHFQGEMTAKNISKLIPAFQRACKMISSDFTSTMGYLDNMLATFFADYSRLLVELYPLQTTELKQLRESFMEAFKKHELWGRYISRIDNVKSWNRGSSYKTHKHVLLAAFFMLERKINLPMLSTPTHEPCWVSPLTLVQRLIKYKVANVAPADIDFQVAVSRCSTEYHQEALELAARELAGEYRQLISFMLGGEYQPQEMYKYKPVWLVAALTRAKQPANPQWFAYSSLPASYLTANFTWAPVVEPYTYKKWDYVTRKNVDTQAKRSKIVIEFEETEKKISAIKNLFAKLMPAKTPIAPSVYDMATITFRYSSDADNDVMRLIYLNPNHPELWLARIINAAMQSPDFSSESDKRIIIHALEGMMALGTAYGPMAHLLVASAMISNDKTVRAYAAEVWIHGASQNTISSQQIGDIIGRHQAIELSPFKRFTDLLQSNLFQVSKPHNQALQTLLNACLARLSNKPATGLKKLLEIYTEVLAANKPAVIPAEVLAKLDIWGEVEALGKVVGKVKLVGGVK
ncbi:DUF6493 family protein [Mucilaginibacter ginsenosidivorax]|uniref:Uncharacterized protein n=1 Tax=Mucilaginibacter ginsenosidivorax TaxID=862126 RepID=A0A5B8W4E0_9SPHI|nr:DUF6493 family protein [Mucilaginibacter ginsenosidivorax]QEC78704.1 hypothetical protein FSB76_23155 [Mucilaginibacter ginsenosidivorax]